MQFTQRLRAPIERGEVTISIRIWRRPHVRAGHKYRLGSGHVVVDKIHEIGLEDITPALARRSGFAGVVDLLKVAKHGAGENVYLVEFHYERPPRK
jgi:hypothetical protein